MPRAARRRRLDAIQIDAGERSYDVAGARCNRTKVAVRKAAYRAWCGVAAEGAE